MQIIITQSALKGALADVASVVPGRPALPVLGNVLLRAEGERAAIAGTNLETGITRHIEARVLRSGATTVPARLLADVAGGLPEADVTLTLDEATQILRLDCGGFEAEMHGIDAGEFPTLPAAAAGVELTRLPAEELRAALAQVVFAAAEDEARPVLNGVMLQIADRITLGATDGFRLAIKHLPLRTAPLAEATRLVAPASALSALIALLRGCKEEVVIATSPGGAQLVFVTPAVELVTRLVNGTRPKGRGFPHHRAEPVRSGSYRPSEGVLPLRGSPGEGEEPKPLVTDVTCGVEVAVMACPAVTPPHPVGEPEVSVDGATRRAEPRGREETPYNRQMLPVPAGLVGELEAQLAPRGVEDGLAELGSRNSSDRKILNADGVILADKATGELVEEVLSLITDAEMLTGDGAAGLLPPLAALLAAREMALEPHELALGAAEGRRRWDALTVAEHGQLF
jgi:hypothetical protein